MLKRIPVLPTIVVLIAVGIMIRLGFWQIDRMHQKEALLVRYAAAESYSADAQPAQFGGDRDAVLYRHTAFTQFLDYSDLMGGEFTIWGFELDTHKAAEPDRHCPVRPAAFSFDEQFTRCYPGGEFAPGYKGIFDLLDVFLRGPLFELEEDNVPQHFLGSLFRFGRSLIAGQYAHDSRHHHCRDGSSPKGRSHG